MNALEKALLKGYAISAVDEYGDQILEKYDLIAVRGMCNDYLYKNDAYGRTIVKKNEEKKKKKK